MPPCVPPPLPLAAPGLRVPLWQVGVVLLGLFLVKYVAGDAEELERSGLGGVAGEEVEAVLPGHDEVYDALDDAPAVVHVERDLLRQLSRVLREGAGAGIGSRRPNPNGLVAARP